MASMIGLNNNSDDSDSENVGTQDNEATINKKKRLYYFLFILKNTCVHCL